MTTHSLALASRAPCDTKTLARAARDFGEKEPAFAIGAGLLALHWLVQGYGYEITGADVWNAYRATLAAAERRGKGAEVKAQIRKLVAGEPAGGFVTKVLGRELGSDRRLPPASRPEPRQPRDTKNGAFPGTSGCGLPLFPGKPRKKLRRTVH
jgi:hypothetical protein